MVRIAKFGQPSNLMPNTSDTNLAGERTQLRHVSAIPNTEGFTLRLFKGNVPIECTVKKDVNGCYVCVDRRGTYRLCTAFDGWLPLN